MIGKIKSRKLGGCHRLSGEIGLTLELHFYKGKTYQALDYKYQIPARILEKNPASLDLEIVNW